MSYMDDTNPDFINLKKAQEEINRIIELANEKKREADNMQKILSIQNRIIFPSGTAVPIVVENKPGSFTIFVMFETCNLLIVIFHQVGSLWLRGITRFLTTRKSSPRGKSSYSLIYF